MHSNMAACKFHCFYTTAAPCGHLLAGRRPASQQRREVQQRLPIDTYITDLDGLTIADSRPRAIISAPTYNQTGAVYIEPHCKRCVLLWSFIKTPRTSVHRRYTIKVDTALLRLGEDTDFSQSRQGVRFIAGRLPANTAVRF